MEACTTGLTESSRLMVSDSANQMVSLADSGFNMEEDRLNIILLTALFVVMPASTLPICGNM